MTTNTPGENTGAPPAERPAVKIEKRGPGSRRVVAAAPPAQKVAPDKLRPDISANVGVAARTFLFWIGVTADCPVEHIDMAGENFPKVSEDLLRERDGSVRRVPRMGALIRMDARKFERLQERLTRTVVRMYDDPGEKDEPGTGENMGDMHRRPRRGAIITIPTEEDLKSREARGMPARRYQAHTGDRPASEFMYCVLCRDQKAGERTDTRPATIAEVGLDNPFVAVP